MFLSFMSNGLLAVDLSGVADVFSRQLQNKAPLYDLPKALDDLWYMAMQGSLYKLVAFLGMFIAVFAVGFWCVKFYIALDEGTMKPAVAQMVWPVLIVLLLANGGEKMRDVTIGSRNILNAVNHSVSEVIGAEVNVRTALAALSGNYELQMAMGTYLNICNQITDYPKYLDCMNKANVAIDLKQGNFERALKTSLPGQFQTNLNRWSDATKTLKNNVLKAKTPDESQQNASAAAANSGSTSGSTAASGTTAPANSSATLPAGFDPFNKKDSAYNTESGIDAVIKVLTSTRMAFLYILEAMMLVTGLVGPIFVALSLFPVGTKPMVAWGVSFLTIGFCKICYNLISGLSAIAMVYAGPEGSDMTIASVVLGLLSPVLSFVIASNSGFSALSTVTYTAQSFGLNAGMSSYVMGQTSSGGSTASSSPTNSNSTKKT
jgi:hypothetical protein